MKIIDMHVRAASMFGMNTAASNGTESTITRHPFTGSGWTAFLMPGQLPTDEAAIAKIFKQDSLADLYNKSMGVARGLLSFITKVNVIHLQPQSNFYYKGVNFYKRQWGVNYRALYPNRITENASTKRSVSQLLAGSCLANAVYRTETFGDGNFIAEFDTAVKLTHIVRDGLTMPFSVVAIADDNTETSLGTWTAMTGDATMYQCANPQTAKRFRISASNNVNFGPIVLITDTTDYTTAPTTLPGWVVLAHTNTRACGDFEKSPLIPYIAEVVGHGDDGVAQPFTLRTLNTGSENIFFSPKIRFDNRSL